MQISNEAREFWTWIVQREYADTLENYKHIEDEKHRIEIETTIVLLLNEYNHKFLGRSFAHQIELNKKMKMCDPSLPNPFERYVGIDWNKKQKP